MTNTDTTDTYNTITEIRQANADAGQQWFSPSSMQWFRSRVLRGVIGGRFFITSERNGDDSPRMYSVRVVDDLGHVDTVGEFGGYATAAQARSAARRAAAIR